jgi:uncharacterized tellurite resistance protein B-like protein
MFRISPENDGIDVEESAIPAERDLVIAVIIVLLEMATVDNNFAPEELRMLVSTINKEFRTSDEEVGSLLEVARVIRKQPGATSRMIEAINKNFSSAQREHVLMIVWKIALADGIADQLETGLATTLRQNLDLTMEQAIRARQLAEKK